MSSMASHTSQDNIPNMDETNPPYMDKDPIPSNPLEVEDEGRVEGQVEEQTTEENDTFKVRKRGRWANAWADFEINYVDGLPSGATCKHCNKHMAYSKGGPTTGFNRHREKCVPRKINLRNQNKLNFVPVEPGSDSPSSNFISPLHDGKFDMESMRESIAHWILMHEHSFSIVEEEGFNFMMKRANPEWRRISRQNAKNDCVQVYDIEKKKLKTALKNVEKVCITTDLWKSKPQKIEYMVITGHWIDSNWKLQKRVLSFVHLPPPRRGTQIADAIFKCLREWEIEKKVFSVSVDNASANDACIKTMKDTISKSQKLPCGGKLFHVRCPAHILNIMVQHGLQEIKVVLEKVHDSIDYLNGSDSRLKLFAEIAQQLQIPQRKLILECKTRWNSTYEMLTTALKFKDVFPRYADRDPTYTHLPSDDGWVKVEKLLPILGLMKRATDVISGYEYPTSNLFLSYVCSIKESLDKNAGSSDDFIGLMAKKMKERFDKYWGECNLVMAIAAVLDPRLKMVIIELTFPNLYNHEEAQSYIKKTRDTLYELYSEYASQYHSSTNEHDAESEATVDSTSDIMVDPMSHMIQRVAKQKAVQPWKSDLDLYFEEPPYTMTATESSSFDILIWWKQRQEKYGILAKMAVDILAIPITTVASEATFSAGSRVIDPYRASLAPDTVQALLCGGDWLRHLHGVTKKKKIMKPEDEHKEIELPTFKDSA